MNRSAIPATLPHTLSSIGSSWLYRSGWYGNGESRLPVARETAHYSAPTCSYLGFESPPYWLNGTVDCNCVTRTFRQTHRHTCSVATLDRRDGQTDRQLSWQRQNAGTRSLCWNRAAVVCKSTGADTCRPALPRSFYCRTLDFQTRSHWLCILLHWPWY